MIKIWMLNRIILFTQKYLVNFLLHTVDRLGAMSVKFAQIPYHFSSQSFHGNKWFFKYPKIIFY